MAEEAQAQKPPKDLKKILGMVFVLVNLCVSGGGAYLTYISTLGYKSPQVSEDELNKELKEFQKQLLANPIVYNMEPFNTNLDGIPRRLIRIQVGLEMLDAEGFEEVMGLGAGARDAIVRVLNGKTFQDVETVQGKLHLKNEIMATMNSYLTRGVVQNVYFSDFAVQ